MRQPNKPPTPLDINAALDDFKREKDETTAWNKPPIIDVPRQNTTGNLAAAIGQMLKKKKLT